MSKASLRAAVVAVALLLVPLHLRAQAAQPATAPAKPAPTAAPAKPAPAPAARPTSARAAAAPTTAPAATPAPAPAPAPTAAPAAPARDAKGRFVSKKAAAVTATCNDGFAWSGSTRSGACSGHGGVKSWN